MNKRENITRLSGIFSISLLLIYLALKYFFVGGIIIDYLFIIIHLIIILFGVFLFGFVYLAIFISFKTGKMKKSDKQKVKLAMKTMPHRIFLSLFYWAVPLGRYCFSVYPISLLYIFKWEAVWFPILFILIEVYIKKKEKSINSPVVEHW